jgi:glycosyltransferase involved in cell wall biosynthesis
MIKIAYYCTGNIWNTGGGATVMKNILINTSIKKDEQLLFVSSWIDIPSDIAYKFTVIKLKTPKKRVFQELYDQLVAPFILLKYSIDRVVCLNSIIPLLYPKRLDVFYQMRMFYFEEFDNIAKKIKNQLGIWSIKKSHTVYVASQDHKNDLLKSLSNIDKNKIKVNYLGYSADSIYEKNFNHTNDDYFLFVSVIRPYKNLDRLIKAYKLSFDKLDGKIPKLYIVGNIPKYKGINNYMNEIYAFIREYKLEEFIFFKGSKKHEEVISLMKGSKALIFPTLFEGFGLPLLEAMANKVPVLTSNRNSLPEVGLDTVIYFDPESIDEMSGKMMNLLNNGYDKNLIEEAFIRSKLFDWRETSKAIELDVEFKI